MKFTKLTLVALLLALLVCAFAACGGETEGTEGGNESGDGSVETVPTPETDENGEHVHTIVEKIDEPTCTEKGYKREVCAICDEQISVKPIAQVDHVAAAPATCTEGSVCKFCNVQIDAATGHTLGEVTESKPATNTEAGYKKATCSVCGEVVTTIIPAGITEDFSNFSVGAISKDTMASGSALAADFSFDGFQDGGFEIAEESGNKYIKKMGPNAQLKFNNTSILNSDKLEFTFDFRLDSDMKATKGILSLVNGGKEMRILNVNSNTLYFGINDNGIVPVKGLSVGTWTNIKVSLDTTTYNYEIYVDGTKCFYIDSKGNVVEDVYVEG